MSIHYTERLAKAGTLGFDLIPPRLGRAGGENSLAASGSACTVPPVPLS